MKKNPLKRFYLAAGYLLGVHVLALLVFGLLRLALFLSTDYDFPEGVKGDWLLQSVAFVKGVWFDNVIACYIIVLPLVVMWIASLCNYTAKWLYNFTWVWLVALYAVAFGITAANIPYFGYFFKTINSSIFNWFSYASTTAGMIFGESSYYFPMILGVVAIVLFAVAARYFANISYRMARQVRVPFTIKEFFSVLVLGAALVGLSVFGIRGRTGYNPIKVSQAYYCQDPFLNQIGVNPVFNLLTSYLDDQRKENRQLELMPAQEALAKAQEFLGREGIEGISPFARVVAEDSAAAHKGKNIVFIFMESMSAYLMGAYGNHDSLTPFLDSLYKESLVFNNIYSAGIHTNHGMYSTLYSFPTIMKRNAMKGSVIPRYSGFPTVLKENGYTNLFFMTHESQYDNMNAFFRTNGFDEIYAEENYPNEKIANHFGVQDDYLYEYALPILDERGASGNPFFAVLLSISNHPPYIIPDKFTPRSSRIEQQIVEYADWAIRGFMEEARKRDWYSNTIFVFMGDHGKLVGTPETEMPQSYNHVPLMVFGEGIGPGQVDLYGGQIDVAPTLLGMMGIGYTQNNYGIDLLKEQRPCIFYGADNLIAARSAGHLYIYSPETGQEFRYRVEEGQVSPADDNDEYRMLKEYCFAMLQSAEYMVREGNITDKTLMEE
ncbi:MAG: sulfatase-like hydrolase/transferase [Bacteroidales bacterium]|nr:sulfatase-like hydrolase/transferase [Bacteroidales bacterium]